MTNSDDTLKKYAADSIKRQVNAKKAMIETLTETGGISESEAEKVFDLYKSQKIRAIKYDGYMGVWKATAGAFFDRAVILRAVTFKL